MLEKNLKNQPISSIIVNNTPLLLHAKFMMSDNQTQKRDKEELEAQTLSSQSLVNISPATEKDWEDFFAVQEDIDTLFDR